MGRPPKSGRPEKGIPHSTYTQGIGSDNTNDECVVDFKTKLMKPNLATGKLKKGDILHIGLDDKENIRAFDEYGYFCGNIVSTKHQKKMLSCLKNNRDYQAEVLDNSGLGCEIRVYGGR
jgi:hypothetical protein